MRRRMIVAAVGLAVLVAAGCGGDEATPTPAPTVEATPTSTPTPEPTPVVQWPAVATARITTDDLNVRTGPGSNFPVVGRLNTGAEVPVSGTGAGGNWLGLPGIGWVVNNGAWVQVGTAAALPSITPGAGDFEFVGPMHPPGTSTGIPVLDEAARVLTGGDRAAILRVVAPASEMANVPPPSACPGAVRPAADLEAHLDEFLASEVVAGEPGPLRLYAVVGAGGDAPTFILVLAFERGEGRQVWVAPDGSGITWFSLGCGASKPGDLLLQPGQSEPFFWLRPAVVAPLEPVEG
ncbi:MAG: hypothetical protein AMXMBFR23_25300 [Chloroflexota bacterium]